MVLYAIFGQTVPAGAIISVVAFIAVSVANALFTEKALQTELSPRPYSHKLDFYTVISLLLPAYGFTRGAVFSIFKKSEDVQLDEKHADADGSKIAAKRCYLMGAINMAVVIAVVIVLLLVG